MLTAHAAKGLEWDLVCVAAVQEGSWPDLRRRSTCSGRTSSPTSSPAASPRAVGPRLAEERRLFYVAATRARHRLDVSAVTDAEQHPSRFLDEIDPIDGDRPLTEPRRGLTSARWSPNCGRSSAIPPRTRRPRGGRG